MIYTYDGYRDLTRAQILSWGYKCDGFLAFSTETIPELGIVTIQHPGPEAYQNMWQKVRAIWAYVATHYLDEYDWFHIGGDDHYVLVENLRHFLQIRFGHDNPEIPIVTGARINVHPNNDATARMATTTIVGGPGYTMNRAALQLFHTKGLGCAARLVGSMEDRILSKCFTHDLQIELADSRDPPTGQQLYHNFHANSIFLATTETKGFMGKMKRYWRDAPHPNNSNKTTTSVGDLNGLDAAFQYSISFHYLKTVKIVARYTAILYRLCPPETPLGASMLL